MQRNDKKQIFFISGIASVIASLCCVTPIVLVLLGLSSVTFAASLGNLLYGEYKWLFRLIGLVALLIAIYFYFRRKGICTFDQYKRNRNKVINVVSLTVITAVLMYLFFNYVILEVIGVKLNLWSSAFWEKLIP